MAPFFLDHPVYPVISAQRCASQPEIAKKFSKSPYFGGSRSLKVIYVGTPGKLVSSACYIFLSPHHNDIQVSRDSPYYCQNVEPLDIWDGTQK